jgi:hypothetical protein
MTNHIQSLQITTLHVLTGMALVARGYLEGRASSPPARTPPAVRAAGT